MRTPDFGLDTAIEVVQRLGRALYCNIPDTRSRDAGEAGFFVRSTTPSAVVSTMNSVPSRQLRASRTDFGTTISPLEESFAVPMTCRVRHGKATVNAMQPLYGPCEDRLCTA